jgi:hypothetical protein
MRIFININSVKQRAFYITNEFGIYNIQNKLSWTPKAISIPVSEIMLKQILLKTLDWCVEW